MGNQSLPEPDSIGGVRVCPGDEDSGGSGPGPLQGLRGARAGASRQGALPVTPRFRVVAHVGSLDQPRAPRGRSFEGGGLSVSLHPKAWTSIAKLGGQETWVLRKDAPAFFEVPHPVPEEILAWGAASGFLEPTREFCFEVEDDEIGRTLVLTFATREAAGDEAEEHGAEVYEQECGATPSV